MFYCFTAPLFSCFNAFMLYVPCFMPEEQKIKNQKETERAFSFDVSDIYVMPERFYSKPEKRVGRGLRLTLIIGGAVILSLVFAAVFVLLTLNSGQEEKPVVTTTTPTEEKPLKEEVKEAPVIPTPISPEEEEVAEETIPVEEGKTPPPAVLIPSPTLSIDTDRDGLTDEEEVLYATGLNRPDSDADGYLDGEELENLYNPLGEGLLKDSGLVNVYKNSPFGYNLFYPSSWLSRSIDDTGREVIFNSGAGEFIQVIVEENQLKLSPLEWYLNQSPGISREQIESIDAGDFRGIRSPDTLTLYLVPKRATENNLIYIITYNIGTKTEMNFKATFEMMIKSFSLAD